MTKAARYSVLAGLLLGNLACWLLTVWGFRRLIEAAS
jgi:hypothetical protein